VLTVSGLCLGLALVLAFVTWRQASQLGGLQREVAELASKVEEMSQNKHLELSEKMTQEGGDKSGEFNKQLNELTNTITRAIEQARQAPTLPEKPPDTPPPAEGDKPPPDVPRPADKPSARLVSLGTVADTPAAGPPLLLHRADDRAPWKLLPASGKVESGRPLLNLPESRVLLSLDGGVDLWLWGDIQVQESLPIMETSAVLHAPARAPTPS
jgi:hypothetical protein